MRLRRKTRVETKRKGLGIGPDFTLVNDEEKVLAQSYIDKKEANREPMTMEQLPACLMDMYKENVRESFEFYKNGGKNVSFFSTGEESNYTDYYQDWKEYLFNGSGIYVFTSFDCNSSSHPIQLTRYDDRLKFWSLVTDRRFEEAGDMIGILINIKDGITRKEGLAYDKVMNGRF